MNYIFKEIFEKLYIKIKAGIFNKNNKNVINIQQIKDDEIFTFNKFSFTDLIFNSSYRTIINIKNYKNYNSFKINILDIEENLTELLLKNKNLLNKDLII